MISDFKPSNFYVPSLVPSSKADQVKNYITVPFFSFMPMSSGFTWEIWNAEQMVQCVNSCADLLLSIVFLDLVCWLQPDTEKVVLQGTHDPSSQKAHHPLFLLKVKISIILFLCFWKLTKYTVFNVNNCITTTLRWLLFFILHSCNFYSAWAFVSFSLPNGSKKLV